MCPSKRLLKATKISYVCVCVLTERGGSGKRFSLGVFIFLLQILLFFSNTESKESKWNLTQTALPSNLSLKVPPTYLFQVRSSPLILQDQFLFFAENIYKQAHFLLLLLFRISNVINYLMFNPQSPYPITWYLLLIQVFSSLSLNTHTQSLALALMNNLIPDLYIIWLWSSVCIFCSGLSSALKQPRLGCSY